MNTFEFYRAFEKITPDVIKSAGVESVHINSDVVIQDAIVANAEGLTFAGNQISKYKPFTDWEETGLFHENLSFHSKNDIEFTSRGEGANAIFNTFPDDDTIAPSAKILDSGTISDIKKSFIQILKDKIK
jgi:hypothetical protein